MEILKDCDSLMTPEIWRSKMGFVGVRLTRAADGSGKVCGDLRAGGRSACICRALKLSVIRFLAWRTTVRCSAVAKVTRKGRVATVFFLKNFLV